MSVSFKTSNVISIFGCQVVLQCLFLKQVHPGYGFLSENHVFGEKLVSEQILLCLVFLYIDSNKERAIVSFWPKNDTGERQDSLRRLDQACTRMLVANAQTERTHLTSIFLTV